VDTDVTSPFPDPPFPAARASGLDRPGDSIGPYTLVRVIGQGGFGTVWLAERTQPMVQRVAIKIIKAGMDSAAVIARFEQERQALAVMDHPNVAKVFDGGITASGRPYFVMELVQGEPISAFCDGHKLTIRQRLELFVPVCEAVQHAHHKGIIHRDLKPTNVLVGMVEGRPVAKVIDFGIAKATDASGMQNGVFSIEGQLIGTPEYMSPEQAGGQADVDTRTDVYSLGVMLYELLVGRLPFDSESLRRRGVEEILRIIREEDPPRPSTRLGAEGGDGETIAGNRRETPASLVRSFRRDLEWIPLKAMRKERQRRYPSAAAVAQDIQRYLEGRALEAAPESRTYLARKFIGRNRALVGAVGGVSIALVGGFAGTLWQAREAARQRDAARAGQAESERITERLRRPLDRMLEDAMASGSLRAAEERASEEQGVPEGLSEAERSAAQMASLALTQLDLLKSARLTAEQERDAARAAQAAEKARVQELETVANFHSSMLSQVDPTTAGVRLTEDVKSRLLTALEKAGVPEDGRAESLAAFEALWSRVNSTDAALALIDETILRQAVGAIDRDFKDQPLVDAGLRQALATRYIELGLFEQALPLQMAAMETRKRLLGNDHPNTLMSINNTGLLLHKVGRVAESERYTREALDGMRRVLGNDHPDTLNAVNNLGALHASRGDYASAGVCYREAVEGYRRVLGVDHPDTINGISGLAHLLEQSGKLTDAEPLAREALDASRRSLGPDHPKTLGTMNGLGNLLSSMGRLEESEAVVREALERRRRVLGESHPKTIETMISLGRVLRARASFERAEALFRDALAQCRRSLGDDHTLTLAALSSLGFVLHSSGRIADAEPVVRDSLERSRRLRGDDHPETINAINSLAVVLQNLDRLEEAEVLQRESLERSRRVLGDDHPTTLATIGNMAGLLVDLGKPDEAEGYHREVVERRRRVLGDDHPHTILSVSELGIFLQDQKKPEAAEPLLREALERFRRVLGDDHPDTLLSLGDLAKFLRESGRPAESEPLYREGLERRRRVMGEAHTETLNAAIGLSLALRAQGKHAESIEVLSAAEPAARGAFEKSGEPRFATLLRNLARSRAAAGFDPERFSLAEGNYLEAHAALVQAGNAAAARACAKDIAAFYKAWEAGAPGAGHGAKAEEWAGRAQAEPAGP
jgi:serine/threonine protein kinase